MAELEEKGGSSDVEIEVKESEDVEEEKKDDCAAATGEAASKKKKTVDWPLKGIQEPHEHDVLYGRGGGTNHHPGNKRYRKIVEDRKLDYVNSKRLDKPLVALGIIREWRGQDPPGRFLKMDEKTGHWSDVGDKKAREKTSQALREKAPLIRKQQEIGKHGEDDEEESKGDEKEDQPDAKMTRFADGTNLKDGDGSKKPILARDHSLGREYLDEGEAVTLDGFSWQDPFQNGARRTPSGGPPPPPPPPPPMQHPGATGFGSDPRNLSYGSAGYRFPSQGSMGPPIPSQGSMGMGPPLPSQGSMGPSMQSYGGRYSSWGSVAMGPPPPGAGPPLSGYPPGAGPPPPSGYPGYPHPPPHQASWSREGSWHQQGRDTSVARREHSLGQNPLPDASVNQPAIYPFDGRTASWGRAAYPPPHYSSYGPPPPPPPPPAYAPPPQVDHPRRGGPPSPPYAVNPAVASMWSGKSESEIAKTWSSGSSNEDYDHFSPAHQQSNNMAPQPPRPDVVKRATSNQNETAETHPGLQGPSVKRAALNRDNSTAANRLKEKYGVGTSKQFNADQEVTQLSTGLDEILIGVQARKKALTMEDRMTTIDVMAMDLMIKPLALDANNRSSTIDALALDDLENDSALCKPQRVERNRTMEEVFNDLREGLPKPNTLSMGQRMTTSDWIDIVNEPLGED
jgi:hypothetical protein